MNICNRCEEMDCKHCPWGNPCLGCGDYDEENGCKSEGACSPSMRSEETMAKVTDKHYEEFKKEVDKLMNKGVKMFLDDIEVMSGKATLISEDAFQSLCDEIVYANIEDLDIGEIYILGRFIVCLKEAMFDIDEKTEMEEN